MSAQITDPRSVDRADTTTQFQTYYDPDYAGKYRIAQDDPEIEQAMLDRDMDIADMGIWAVNAFDPVRQYRSILLAYYNAFNTRAGIIVAKANYRSNDRTAKVNQLQWSEIVYQTWKEAAAQEAEEQKPHGPISNLRAVIRSNVVNSGTQKVMTAAYKSNNWEPEKDTDWRTWTKVSAPSFFYGLLGTTNIKGVIWLLRDHAVEIGRKDISAIYTLWLEENLNIWIEIIPSVWTQCPGAACTPTIGDSASVAPLPKTQQQGQS
ncbi:MAG: hypothetical protein Q9169_002662 [Polycauliona sp. 2 TL-2023]